jgi:hypothetical protein
MRADGNTQDSCFTLGRIKVIIKWLIFVNQSVCIKFEEECKTPQDYASSNHGIINWIFYETFHPKKQSLPIIGNMKNIEEFTCGKVFGEFQTIFMNYLTQIHVNELFKFNTSLLLLDLYINLSTMRLASGSIKGIQINHLW